MLGYLKEAPDSHLEFFLIGVRYSFFEYLIGVSRKSSIHEIPFSENRLAADFCP